MQPFDKYQADAGSLESCSSDLGQLASGAMQNSNATTSAYAPATANWSGLGAPELAAAPRPVQQAAQASNAALAWASAVSRYWAGKVKHFNNTVDKIVQKLQDAKGSDGHYGATGTNGKPPTGAQVSAARAKALRLAKSEWWKAYNADISEGGQKAASMLSQGPTPGNLAEVEQACINQPGSAGSDPLPYLIKGFKGQLLPPGSYPGTLIPWAVGRGTFAGNRTLDWLTKVTHGRVTGGSVRYIPLFGGRYWLRPVFGPKTAGDASLYDKLLGAKGVLGRIGSGASLVGGYFGQRQQDSNRTDLDEAAKEGRAADRGILATVGASAGAAALGGAEGLGAGIATGPGAVLLGGLGLVVGGVGGGAAGNIAANHTMKQAGWLGDKVNGEFNKFKDGLNSLVHLHP